MNNYLHMIIYTSEINIHLGEQVLTGESQQQLKKIIC